MTDGVPAVYDRYRGEVSVPNVPNGVFRFRLQDLAILSERLGPDYLTVFNEAVRKRDWNTLKLFVQKGFKGAGGMQAPTVDVLEDPPFPMEAIFKPLDDALAFALTGMTAEEFAEIKAKEDASFRAEVEKVLPPGPSDAQGVTSIDSAGPESNAA